MGTRQQQKEATRCRLIEKALELSSKHGFSSTSLREITSNAGLTPSSFYRHFKSLDELGITLIDEFALSLRRLLREGWERVEPGPKSVENSVKILLDHITTHSHHFTFFLSERMGPKPALRVAIDRELNLFITDLSRDLEKKYPSINNVLLVSEIIVSVIFTVGAKAINIHHSELQNLQSRLVKEITIIISGAISDKSKTNY